MPDVLARASIEGAILAGIVWILCRAVPRLSPAAKTALWWCVTARFMAALTASPVMVPVLPSQAPPAATARLQSAAISTSAPGPGPSAPGTSRIEGVAGGWTLALGILWLAGLGVSSGLAIRRWRLTRAAIGRAAGADQTIEGLAAEVAARLGLRRAPAVRLSHETASPLVTGILRPVILLPDGFPSLPLEQRRMALCHEMAHIRRGDTWLGVVPAIAERIFFFHPLARLAAREYAFWREAACDAAVLAALDTAPQSYGRLLLDLGVTGRAATLSPAGAAWSFSNLERRITMLHRPVTPSTPTRLMTGAAVAAALIAIVPMQLTARPAAGPPAAAGPIESAAAVAAQARRDDDNLRYVFFVDDGHTTMSGRSGDMERARRHRRDGEPLLWFIRDGDEYIVRDAALLAEVRRIWTEVGRIGAEQGAIGAKQGALGARQGEIGAKQGLLGAEQGIIGAKQGTLGARQAALSAREAGGLSAEQRAAIERERQAIEQDMRALDAEMRALDAKMRELERPMRDLGDDMEALGREMEQLGTKMEEASRKAGAEMRELLDTAIRSGAAQRVR